MYKVLTAPDSELSSYDNVIADGKTAIIVSESGELVKEQADEALFWLPEALPRAHRKGFTNEQEDEKRTRMLSERASELHARRSDIPVLDPDFNYIYMLHPFGWHAFGHLFDSLQRLRHAVPAVPKPWKVLHSHNRQVVDFEVHMEKLGVPRDSLIEIRNDQSFVAPKLWVSPWQEWPANITPENYDWIYDGYTRSVPKTDPTRLYLTRNHVRASERSVLNEEEVLARLEPLGFQVFRGTETIDEMLTLFHNAEMIIGPHGSALANTMFCNPDCRILEFCADNRIDRSFLRKHKKARDYRQVLRPADEAFNITIPMDEIEAFLRGADG